MKINKYLVKFTFPNIIGVGFNNTINLTINNDVSADIIYKDLLLSCISAVKDNDKFKNYDVNEENINILFISFLDSEIIKDEKQCR